MWGVSIMGRLKKITALTLASTMILTGQSVFAEQNDNKISVVVDGSELAFAVPEILNTPLSLFTFLDNKFSVVSPQS